MSELLRGQVLCKQRLILQRIPEAFSSRIRRRQQVKVMQALRVLQEPSEFGRFPVPQVVQVTAIMAQLGVSDS